jgi:hypothetical protein
LARMPLMLAITARVRPPRYTPRVVAALVAAAKQAVFALVPAALGLLALILTVAEVQTVGAAIVPGCFGNRGLSCRGTKSSNPSPSSRQSVSRPHPLSSVENPGFPRGCARPAWRPGRQRRAGCFDIAPTGGNISVGPYSSTAVPLMGSARMPRCTQRSRAFSGLSCAVDLSIRMELRQSRARSADRARQAANGSARGASPPSNRAAAAHRGSLG